MNNFQIPQEAIDQGLIDLTYHDRLIANIDRFALSAGIPPYFIVSRLSKYCSEAELSWVRKINLGKDNGMLYVGEHFNVPMEDKMSAIAGACLRNYTNARVMTVQEVLSLLKTDDMGYPTVLLIPNFCLGKGFGGELVGWQISLLLKLLYSRFAKNLKTVLYVSSEEALISNYGDAFLKHFNSHYFKP